jgi:hypothetical protein
MKLNSAESHSLDSIIVCGPRLALYFNITLLLGFILNSPRLRFSESITCLEKSLESISLFPVFTIWNSTDEFEHDTLSPGTTNVGLHIRSM